MALLKKTNSSEKALHKNKELSASPSPSKSSWHPKHVTAIFRSALLQSESITWTIPEKKKPLHFKMFKLAQQLTFATLAEDPDFRFQHPQEAGCHP